ARPPDLVGGAPNHPLARFDTTGAPWVRIDGLPIWESASDAESEDMEVPILLNLEGKRPGTPFPYAWLGSGDLMTGGSFDSTCRGWVSSDPADEGRILEAHQTKVGEGREQSCDKSYPVVCLEE